jgi:hypothetical protein
MATLNLAMQQQEMQFWCWLAVATSVADFYAEGGESSQCRLASRALGLSTCCSAPSTCDQPGLLADSLDLVGHYGNTHAPLTFAQINNELDEGRPVCAQVRWPDGDEHVVVITGTLRGAQENFYQVADPAMEGLRYMTEDTLRTAYSGTGWWKHTFSTKPIAEPS